MYPSQGQVWRLGKLKERGKLKVWVTVLPQFGFNSEPSPHQQAQRRFGATPEGWEGRASRDTHVFHLHIGLQAILSQLPPVPRGFVATEGGLGTKHIVAVYPGMESKDGTPGAQERALWQHVDT